MSYITSPRYNIIEWRARYDSEGAGLGTAGSGAGSRSRPNRWLVYSGSRGVIVWQVSGSAGAIPVIPVAPTPQSSAAPSVMGGGMPGARKRKATPPSGKVRFVGERKRKKEEEVNEVRVAAEAAAKLKAATTFTQEDYELMSLFSFMR